MSIPWSAQSSFPFYVSFFFSLMIRLLFNLTYFQLNLDPGTLHLIKFSLRFKRYVKIKIWNPLISEGSSGIVNPWKSYQRTFLLKITTKFSSYQFRQGNHSAKYNVYDIKRFSRNMSLTSFGSFNRGRPSISLNSEKIAYFLVNNFTLIKPWISSIFDDFELKFTRWTTAFAAWDR